MSGRRWSDAGVDTDEYHRFFKLIEIPYSPFPNELLDHDHEVEPQGRDQFALRSSREEYLRSYTFCRKQTVREQVKSRLGRIKAAAWAVVGCKCPRALRKQKLAFRSSRSLFGCRAPFLPQCFRVTTL